MWLDKNAYESPNPPQKYEIYTKSWQKLNPTWKYMFWDRKRVDSLFETHRTLVGKYKTFYDTRILEQIEKCDFARFMVLALFGGLYADLKLECVNPLKEIQKNSLHFVLEVIDLNSGFLAKNLFGKNKRTWNTCVLISGTQKSTRQFWFDLLDHIVQNYKENNGEFETTGPWMFSEFIHQWKPRHSSIRIISMEQEKTTGRFRKLMYNRSIIWHKFKSTGWLREPRQFCLMAKFLVKHFIDSQLAIVLIIFVCLLCL